MNKELQKKLERIEAEKIALEMERQQVIQHYFNQEVAETMAQTNPDKSATPFLSIIGFLFWGIVIVCAIMALGGFGALMAGLGG